VVPLDDLRGITFPLPEGDHDALGVGILLGGPSEELSAIRRGAPFIIALVMIDRIPAAPERGGGAVARPRRSGRPGPGTGVRPGRRCDRRARAPRRRPGLQPAQFVVDSRLADAQPMVADSQHLRIRGAARDLDFDLARRGNAAVVGRGLRPGYSYL